MAAGSNGTGTVTDQMADAVSRGQQAMTEAATGMAELWTAAFSGARGGGATAGSSGALPSAGEFVDRMYDTGIAVLEMQRSVAHQVLDALRLR